MAMHTLTSEFLEKRRRELRMSRPTLARRSGVSVATVNRVLSGQIERATMGNVRCVADALEVDLAAVANCSSLEFQQREARAKAEKIVQLVQGTSALEGQAVDAETLAQMVQRTVHELIAGPKRRLWAR